MENLKEIMSKHLICSVDEALEAIEFVHDLLVAQADETEEKYPYATKTINDLNKAAYEVFELEDLFD